MTEKTDFDIFLEHVPFFNVWYKLLFSSLYHFIIFLILIFTFWYITSEIWFLAILVEFLLTTVSNVPLMFMLKDVNKTREKYLKKYKNLPWQKLWLRHSYTSPFGCAAFYTPLLLRNNYFIFPAVIQLPSNIFTKDIFPEDISVFLGLIVITFGILLIKPAKDKDRDMGNYLLVMKPEDNRLITTGMYDIIRHPRYLSRVITTVGFGIFTNNLLAIGVALIHFVPYLIFMRVADNALIKSFGKEIQEYQKNVPALLPRYKNWKRFFKIVFRLTK